MEKIKAGIGKLILKRRNLILNRKRIKFIFRILYIDYYYYYRAGAIEAWGRGIDLMISESHKNNLPDPTVRVFAGGIEMIFSKITENPGNIQENGNVTDNVTDNVTENITETRVELLIRFFEEKNNISTLTLARKLGVTRMTIARDLEILKNKGIIKRI